MTQRLGACYVIVNDRIDFRIKIYKFVKAGKRKKKGVVRKRKHSDRQGGPGILRRGRGS